METADWALAISLCSLLVSLAGFVWNVWSKFIYPKPKVRISFYVGRMVDSTGASPPFICVSATNYGPGPVKLHSAVGCARKGPFRRKNLVFNTLHDFPDETDLTLGPFSGGLPKQIEPGENFRSYLPLRHQVLKDESVYKVGFYDTFDRYHWAPRKQVKRVRKAVAEAYSKDETATG